MKSFIFTLSLLSSSVSFGQSMLVQKNGQLLTIDKQGQLLNLGNFVLPYTVKNMGGNYFIDQDRKVQTVDVGGYYYSKKDADKVPSSIEVFGGNYFISKRGTLYTVNDQGFLFEGKKESEYKDVSIRGGSFFISEKKVEDKKVKVIFVISQAGQVLEMNVPGLDVSTVHNSAGGQFFTTTKGELFTVSAEGYIYSKKDLGVYRGWEFRSGGNFFFYQNSLFTVADNGVVLKQNATSSYGKVMTLGSNFFATQEKKLFTVAADGSVHEVSSNFNISDISHFSHL